MQYSNYNQVFNSNHKQEDTKNLVPHKQASIIEKSNNKPNKYSSFNQNTYLNEWKGSRYVKKNTN